jgi:DNA-binding MarR family transcriptional regulator/ribosomal protein S18 acetylase RimI-like enzyme
MRSGEIDGDTVRLVREFNRQLARKLRLLNWNLSGTGLNVTQVNILWEISRSGGKSWDQLAKSLLIDKGLLSRNLKLLEGRQLINRVRDKRDNRKFEFSIAEPGEKIIAAVNGRANQGIGEILKSVRPSELTSLVAGLMIYGRVMGLPMETRPPVHIRPHRIGDAGYVTFLHGIIYAEEYGLDSTFELEVGQGIMEFVGQFDPKWDGFWVAEAVDHVVGAIVIVHRGRELAQLRWFILYPAYRGLGLGRKLMTCAVNFCRDKQFKKVFLWTFDELDAAIHLYRSFGFERNEKKTHRRWGRDLTEERYELDLERGLEGDGEWNMSRGM